MTTVSGAPAGPLLDVDGAAAPPRANGELVFTEPWEGRAFGMAVTLAEAGVLTWDGFRDALVARIAAWESEHGADGASPSACSPEFRYYHCWLAALEDQLVGTGRLGAAEVAERSDLLAGRPAGHDHGHDHGHGH